MFKSKASRVYTIPSYGTATYSYDIEQWNITISNQLVYCLWNEKKFKTYIVSGINVSASKIQTAQYYEEFKDPFTLNMQPKSFDMKPDDISLWFSLPLKIGFISYNKLDVSFKYILSTAVRTDKINNHYRIWSVQIGFNFN